MDELLNSLIEKYKEKNKEVEEYLRTQGDTNISYSSEHIKILAETGYLPKELWDYHCQSTKEIYERKESLRKFKEENPDLPPEEFMKQFFPTRQLSLEETAKSYEDCFMSGQFLMWLLKNRELLNKDPSFYEKINKTLFKGIDLKEDIGIVRAITDSLYHLEKILNNMECKPLYENMYEAKGSVTNSIGETITLEYTFRASSKEDAKSALEEYKNTMLKKGLRTWMAYWCVANERGRLEYKCTLTEVMKWISDEEREAYFQTKEKEEFWALTKMLGMTKLSRSRIVKRHGKGKGKEAIQWIEQPLVEIFGGERLLENEDKYPEAIAIRVLMPKIGKKGFAPALFKISTMKLNPNDIYLAFIVQLRACQMKRGERDLFFDWDYLFEIGNLKQTAISNSRMAKAKIRNKMDNLKNVQIIDTCDEHLIGMSIQPKRAKAKKKSESKNTNT